MAEAGVLGETRQTSIRCASGCTQGPPLRIVDTTRTCPPARSRPGRLGWLLAAIGRRSRQPEGRAPSMAVGPVVFLGLCTRWAASSLPISPGTCLSRLLVQSDLRCRRPGARGRSRPERLVFMRGCLRLVGFPCLGLALGVPRCCGFHSRAFNPGDRHPGRAGFDWIRIAQASPIPGLIPSRRTPAPRPLPPRNHRSSRPQRAGRPIFSLSQGATGSAPPGSGDVRLRPAGVKQSAGCRRATRSRRTRRNCRAWWPGRGHPRGRDAGKPR